MRYEVPIHIKVCVPIISLWCVFFLIGALNHALQRPVSQSSTFNSSVASLAVDGNAVDDSSCSITDVGDLHPWWKVQLAYPVWVTHVELTNRRISGEYQYMNVYRERDYKPLSEPMMVSLPTHIHVCVTRPQWVSTLTLTKFGCNLNTSF